MNKKIKILLLVMIVSLSTFIFPFAVHSKNVEKTQSMETPNIINTDISEKDIGEYVTKVVLKPINFEIDKIIEEMNQKIEEIETIEDRKDWFISYKNIIEEYSYIIDPPETIYDYFTDEELDLLFHVVQAEIGDEYSFEQKVNVANVIFNRFQLFQMVAIKK